MSEKVDYKYVIQFKHNGRWWVTAQATNMDSANTFMETAKKEFGYEYRAITFEQYEQERSNKA